MVRIGAWIGLGWQTVTGSDQFWSFVRFTLIFLAGITVLSFSGIGAIILMGPALAGVYALILHFMRNGRLETEPFKLGFQSDTFVQALLANLVIAAFGFAAYMLVYTPLFIIMMVVAFASGPGASEPDFFFVALPIIIILLLGAMLVIHTLYLFPFLLIVDRKLPFWQALETSRKRVQQNFGGFLFFSLALGGLNLLGLLACLVGVLVTAPVTYCAIAAAYRELWPEDPIPAAEILPTG